MNEAISLQQLTKQYGEKTAVAPITLTIAEGELFGLLGVNGAGKTTLIQMLCGLTQPTAGDASLLGHRLSTDAALIRSTIAMSPQETSIAPNLTVRENLLLMARLQGFSKADAAQKTETLIAQFSLQPYEKQRGKTLSGGWQRKLSIAMALIAEPRILFLDEPTLGLDIVSRRELWSMIQHMKGKTTIVLTTHYLEEAEALCDRICIMKDGDMKALGAVEELNTSTGQTSFEETFIHYVTGGNN